MKKKNSIKYNVGGLMSFDKSKPNMAEMFSTIHSIAKGRGPISGIAAALGKTGMSPLGSFALKRRDKRKARDARMAASPVAMNEMNRMYSGGKVKGKRSIDGCAVRGKTRAKRS